MIAKFEQEAHPKAGLDETPPFEKFEDAFDTKCNKKPTNCWDSAKRDAAPLIPHRLSLVPRTYRDNNTTLVIYLMHRSIMRKSQSAIYVTRRRR